MLYILNSYKNYIIYQIPLKDPITHKIALKIKIHIRYFKIPINDNFRNLLSKITSQIKYF